MKSSNPNLIDINLLTKLDLLAILTDAALTCINRWGVEERTGGVSGPSLVFRFSSFMILYRTPKTMAPGAPNTFGIDVWFEQKKVFPTYWDSHTFKDYQLVSLKRGPWIPKLLALASRPDD